MLIKIKNNIHYFNKIKRYIGFENAWNIYKAVKLKKDGVIKLNFISKPFRIRVNETGDSATFNEVMLRKDYDISLNIQPKTIMDCGANIGLSSIYFANKFPNAQIVSIEPEQSNYKLLNENISKYPNIQTIKSAIWSKSTLVKIQDNGRGTNAYTIIEATANDEDAFPSVSIYDTMVNNKWDTIDLLKIDIEGGEKEIFTNNFDLWLPKVKILIVETHDRYLSCTSKAVFKAVVNYQFNCKIKGANFVFYRD